VGISVSELIRKADTPVAGEHQKGGHSFDYAPLSDTRQDYTGVGAPI
jgi:hypothetical protein